MLLVSANPNYEEPFRIKKPDKITITNGDLKTGFGIRQLTTHPIFTKSFEPVSGITSPTSVTFTPSLYLGVNFTIELYFNSGSFTEKSQTLLSCNGSAFDLYFFSLSTGNYIRFRRSATNYLDSPLDVIQANTDYHLVIRSSFNRIQMILNGVIIASTTSVIKINNITSLFIGSQSYYTEQGYLASSLYYFNIWNHYISDTVLFNPERIKNTTTPSVKIPIIFLEDHFAVDRFIGDSYTGKNIEGSVTKEGVLLKDEKAVIHLIKEDGFKSIRAKVTSANGSFSFKNVPLGKYTIFAKMQNNKYKPEAINDIEIK